MRQVVSYGSAPVTTLRVVTVPCALSSVQAIAVVNSDIVAKGFEGAFPVLCRRLPLLNSKVGA